MHGQIIIRGQLFAGHLVGSQLMKRKKKNASSDNKIYVQFNLTSCLQITKLLTTPVGKSFIA